MAIELIDKIKPKNNGSFPMVDAADVEMPDGSRLSDVIIGYAMAEASEMLQPNTYYAFGEVESLALTLAEGDPGMANEYVFEFVPTAGFTMTITPEPTWVQEPDFPEGKKCQVSILQGLAVMVSA